MKITSIFQRAVCYALLAGSLLATSNRANAAGLLIADGGFGGRLEIKEHDVKVTINNGIAVTHVTQVFHNTEKRQVEALYTFPVPKGASVANFSMWINGKEMVGEVVEKQRAREIYNSYKQVNRDPGLLEQKDYRTFEMRIFPIAAEADQKVQITYYQELEMDHDWSSYVYPLATTAATASVDTRVNGKFAISVDIKSAIPIAAVESPSHAADFAFARPDDNYHQASLELTDGSLAQDVVVSQHLARPKTGLDIVTSAKPGEDGYFSMTLTAGEELAVRASGMDYVFVLDVSGSMSNDGKLLLSKDCIGAFINELGANDRFELMTFNVAVNQAFGIARDGDASAKQGAINWLSQARAAGGTVLQPAMTAAYRYASPDRPLNDVILSDGMTEPGERTQLLQLIGQRPAGTKVFCIGVGNDVNRPLLEQLAADSGGLASFISRGDDFARQAKTFRRKLLRPAATELEIQIAGVETYDIEPRKLPNLYHGSPVRIYGRYRQGGTAQVKVRGSVDGVAWEQNVPFELPKEDAGNPEIERMWAWKRVDEMQKTADRTGSRQAIIPELIRLGEQYSIVTEYTSFLVLENDAEFQRWKITRSNANRLARDRQTQETRVRELESLRRRAESNLGPRQPEPALVLASAKPIPQSVPAAPQPAPVTAAPVPTRATPPSSQSRDISFPSLGGGGGGPVGPLFIAFSWILSRRQRRERTDS
jgi:Ca-activated chloride channel family protein